MTGATGFIGQHLIEDLAGLGYSIRIVSRQKNPKMWVKNTNFELVQGDISNLDFMLSVTKGIDIIINMAAELKNTDNFENTNITGVKNIVASALKNKVKRIVHLSSVGVIGMQYSNVPINVNEETKPNPQNKYEVTKLASEGVLIESTRGKEIELVVLRPTNVYGEHHPKNYLLNFFSRVKREKLFVYRSDAILNYVYVKDLTAVIRFFMHSNSSREIIYNVGSQISFVNFLNITQTSLKAPILKISLPPFLFIMLDLFHYFGLKAVKLKLQSVSNMVAYDDIKLKNCFEYEFGYHIGIENTIKYYQSNNGVL